MSIDLSLPSVPSRPLYTPPSRDRGYIMGPSRVGKTSLMAQLPGALFLACEPGQQAHQVYRVPQDQSAYLSEWPDIERAIQNLVSAAKRGAFPYAAIVVDSIDAMCDTATSYWLAAKRLSAMPDDYGRSIQACYSETMAPALRRLASLPCGLWLLGLTKPVRDGQELVSEVHDRAVETGREAEKTKLAPFMVRTTDQFQTALPRHVLDYIRRHFTHSWLMVPTRTAKGYGRMLYIRGRVHEGGSRALGETKAAIPVRRARMWEAIDDAYREAYDAKMAEISAVTFEPLAVGVTSQAPAPVEDPRQVAQRDALKALRADLGERFAPALDAAKRQFNVATLLGLNDDDFERAVAMMRGHNAPAGVEGDKSNVIA